MGKKESAATIWDWCLAVLPITAFVTLVVVLVMCNLLGNSGSYRGNLVPVSDLSSIYFLVGMILLFPQIFLIIIGRLQFLLQTQGLINRIILYVFHIVILIPFIFLLIVSFVNGNPRSANRGLIVYGILGSIVLYCFFHTVAVVYLYIRRASGSQYSEVALPAWFVICCLVFVGLFGGWIETKGVILGYIVVLIALMYFLGFVPQFWTRARSRTRYSAVSKVSKMIDSLNA